MAPRSSYPTGNGTKIINVGAAGGGVFTPAQAKLSTKPRGSSPSAQSVSTVGKQVTEVTPHLSFPPENYPNPVTQP